MTIPHGRMPSRRIVLPKRRPAGGWHASVHTRRCEELLSSAQSAENSHTRYLAQLRRRRAPEFGKRFRSQHRDDLVETFSTTAFITTRRSTSFAPIAASRRREILVPTPSSSSPRCRGRARIAALAVGPSRRCASTSTDRGGACRRYRSLQVVRAEAAHRADPGDTDTQRCGDRAREEFALQGITDRRHRAAADLPPRTASSSREARRIVDAAGRERARTSCADTEPRFRVRTLQPDAKPDRECACAAREPARRGASASRFVLARRPYR